MSHTYGSMMIIGYSRVSTFDQDPALQLDALQTAGCERIYEDRGVSGKSADRPELSRCLDMLRCGDTLIVWRLDRLGRSLRDLISIVSAFEVQGVTFLSLSESIDTSTATGRLVFHVFAALAEFERNLIRERTQAGLRAARARGRNGGRPYKMTPADIVKAKAMLADPNIQVVDVAKHFSVSRSTLYRAISR